jgi:succinate dehydrogenase hydrophobic anchor subunit
MVKVHGAILYYNIIPIFTFSILLENGDPAVYLFISYEIISDSGFGISVYLLLPITLLSLHLWNGLRYVLRICTHVCNSQIPTVHAT